MSSTIGSTLEERLLVIDGALRKLTVPSYRAIIDELKAAGFAASKRTVQRDIKHMQREYDAPEIYARRCHADENGGRVEYGHYYRDPNWRLEIDQITERDLEAMRLARHLLENYQSHPAAQDLNQAYDKLLDQADTAVQKKLDASLDPIAFAPVVQQRIRPDVWRNVIEAIKRGKSIRMEYDKKAAWSRKGQTSRLVDPYYVVNLGGVWYLIGTAGLQDASIRQYDMARIRSAKITAASFTVPSGFDIEKILAVTFGRYIGDPNDLVTVKVRFSRRVAPLVRARAFHAQEKRHTDKQGRITVSFPVTPTGASPEWRYYHVRSWILSWGADCDVLGPAELKELVRTDVEKMIAARARES